MQSPPSAQSRQAARGHRLFSVLGIACVVNALLVGAFVWKAWPNVTAEPDLLRVGDVRGDIEEIFRKELEWEEDNAWPVYQRISQKYQSLDQEFQERTGHFDSRGILHRALSRSMSRRYMYSSDVQHAATLNHTSMHHPRVITFTEDEINLAWEMAFPLAQEVEEASSLRGMAPRVEEPDRKHEAVWISTELVIWHIDSLLFGGLNVAINDAHWQDAVRWLEAINRVSNQQAGLLIFSGWVYANMRMESALWSLTAGVNQHDMSADDAQQLLSALEMLSLSKESLDLALRTESRRMSRQAVERFDHHGRMMIWKYKWGIRSEFRPWGHVISYFQKLSGVDVPLVARLLNCLSFDVPTWDDVQQEIHSECEFTQQLWDEWSVPMPTYDQVMEDAPAILSSLRVPLVRGWVLGHLYETKLRKTVLRVMLRLEIYHAKFGKWPDQLVDAMSVEDTIDPITGSPFVYERIPEDEDRPYLLKTTSPLVPGRVGHDGIVNYRPQFD